VNNLHIINLYKLYNKLSCESCLSRSSCRTCRARCVECVEPCCSQARQPKCMGLTRRTCRVVSRCDEPSGIWALAAATPALKQNRFQSIKQEFLEWPKYLKHCLVHYGHIV